MPSPFALALSPGRGAAITVSSAPSEGSQFVLDMGNEDREHAAVSSLPHSALLASSITAAMLSMATSANASTARGSYVRVENPVALDNHEEEEGPPRVLFLNRCKGGCTFMPGADNAIENTSQIVNGTSSLAAYPYGEESWAEVLACVRGMYAPFNINVTDQDPGEERHFESVVAGRAQDIGAGGALGIAPFRCDPIVNSINFTFAESIGNAPSLICDVVAQESGHVLGLEHALECADPMTYLPDCGPKAFRDIDAECGEFSPVACDCGREKQNSVKILLDIFGPGSQEASAHIEIVNVSEDPTNSDSNAIAEPGESLLIDVQITNRGNLMADKEVNLKLKSGGHLTLKKPGEPVFVKPGETLAMQLVAEVTPSACGEELDLSLTAALGKNSWSDTHSLTSGITTSTWTSSIATDEPWTADEAEEDEQGGWEYGVPERTIFAGRVVQPDGGSQGPSSSAWMTGLTGAWNESPLEGESVLTTSSIDVGEWHTITGIQYRLWHMAFDRSTGGLDLSPIAHLTVELSKDGGKSWKEIDAVVGQDYRWDVREATFAPITVSSKVKLRFVVSNTGKVDDRLIEIGIDEVTLQGGELTCEPVTGCGCQTGGDSQANWLLMLGLGLLLRRGRTPQRSRPTLALRSPSPQGNRS